METTREGWEEMAAWYDEKQGDEGDLWHRALIDPTLFRVLGPVAGQQVLDLACGNGYIARKLTRLGARVTGVDSSAPILDRARQREDREPLGITYHLADASDLDMLLDASFDAVVCNMALMDIADAEGAIREVSRVLKPGGRFVASLSHPCFDVPNASGWALERIGLSVNIWRKVSRYCYFFADWIPWRIAPDRLHRTRAYHRPLSWYFRALRAAGLAVVALEEPEPTEEFMASDDQGAWIAQIPLHCVIDARKLPPEVLA